MFRFSSSFNSVASAVLLLFLLGCGSSDDPDLENQLVLFLPFDKSTEVPVNSKLFLTFESDVTEEELGALNLELKVSPRNLNNREINHGILFMTGQIGFVKPEVSFSSSIEGKVITITPSKYFSFSTHYDFSVGSQKFTFKTKSRDNARIVEKSGPDGQEVIVRYTEFTHTPTRSSHTVYDGAGSDLEWFTEDDRYYADFDREFDSKGDHSLKHSFYRDSGGYGGVSQRFTVFERGADGELIRTINYAFVGVPRQYPYVPQESDTPSGYNSYSRSDNSLTVISYWHPGDDDLWFTEDDIASSKNEISINLRGQILTELITNYSPGEDNTWGTSDDFEYHEAQKAEYDSNGLLVLTAKVTNIGEDGEWFTEDDSLVFVDSYKYQNQQLVARNDVSSPGDDGVWNSEDDLISYQTTYGYTENGQLNFIRTINAGDDRSPGTLDDSEFMTNQVIYTDSGNAVSRFIRMVFPDETQLREIDYVNNP